MRCCYINTLPKLTMRGSRSGLQWSFSNTSPQILSFKSVQEPGNHNLYPPSLSQRKWGITSQHWQHNDTRSHPQEVRIFPTANQTNQVVPAGLSSILPLAPNVVGSSVASSVSIPPTNCPIVGSTDLRNSSSISTGPCQLTIFYNGSVCVYDNVSPEKAQAIMLLAGNGDSTNSSTCTTAAASPLLASKIQPTVLQPPANENINNVQNHSLGISGSISLPQSVSCAAEVKPVVTAAPVKSSEPPKSGTAIGVGGVNLIPSAVPQARKASLARFLEKRKQRVIGAAPYVGSKNSSECSTVGPGRSPFATNSAISSPLPASS